VSRTVSKDTSLREDCSRSTFTISPFFTRYCFEAISTIAHIGTRY